MPAPSRLTIITVKNQKRLFFISHTGAIFLTKFEHWKLKISCISWWPTVIIKTAQNQPFCEHRHDLRIAEYQQYHWSNFFFTWDMMESIKCSTEKWQITCYQWHKILVMSDKSWSETLCVDLSITCDNTQTFGGRCTILQQRVSESWASHRFIIINKIFALPYDIQYWLCFIFYLNWRISNSFHRIPITFTKHYSAMNFL